MIDAVVNDWFATKKPEYASHALELFGMELRKDNFNNAETELDDLLSELKEVMKEMALAAMKYITIANPSGDDFDRAFRCDGLYTSYLVAYYILFDDIEKHKRLIAAARSQLAMIEDPEGEYGIPENVARNYIKTMPPMLFIDKEWNYGQWRSYYVSKKGERS